jgi:hypothetical protein
VTSYNPITFSWNHVYYGQLVRSTTPINTVTGCVFNNKGDVGVDFVNTGVDVVAASTYPNNLPVVTPGTYPAPCDCQWMDQ